jgi:peptidylglycine monooxygenase
MIILDKDGNYIDSWADDALFDGHGIYITPQDEIFLISRGAHEVLKYNLEGECLLTIGNRENPSFQAPFNHPTDVATSKSGEIFISDGYGNCMVHKFSPEGEHIISWGEIGEGPGQFATPHGIWVDETDRVYVADRENNRIQIFDTEGGFLTEWKNLYHPMDMFMDKKNNLYVTDQVPRFTIFNRKGEIQSRGFSPAGGHGIWGDSSGNLYLVAPDRGLAKLIKEI